MSLDKILRELNNLKSQFNFYQQQVEKTILNLEEMVEECRSKSILENNSTLNEKEDFEMFDIAKSSHYNIEQKENNPPKKETISNIRTSRPVSERTNLFNNKKQDKSPLQKKPNNGVITKSSLSLIKNAAAKQDVGREHAFYNPTTDLLKLEETMKGSSIKFRVGQVESVAMFFKEDFYFSIENSLLLEQKIRPNLPDNIYTLTFTNEKKQSTGIFLQLPIHNDLDLRAVPFNLNSDKSFLFLCFSSNHSLSEVKLNSLSQLEELLVKTLIDKSKSSLVPFYVKNNKIFSIEAKLSKKKDKTVLESSKKIKKKGESNFLISNFDKSEKRETFQQANTRSYSNKISFNHTPFNTFSTVQTIESVSSAGMEQSVQFGQNNLEINNLQLNIPPNNSFYPESSFNYPTNNFHHQQPHPFNLGDQNHNQPTFNNLNPHSNSSNDIFQSHNFLNQPANFQYPENINNNFSFPQFQNNY